jgi:hypothetical protein
MNRFLACLVALSLVAAADASFARSSKKPEDAAAEAKKEAVVAEKKAEKSAEKAKDAASDHAEPVKHAKKKAKKKKSCNHNKDDRYTYPGTFSTRAVEKR